MIYLHVYIHVKPECVEAFRTATIANASASRAEKGCVRFEVFRQADDPQRFVLVEAWRDAQAHAAHRDTLHYIKWRDAVNPMMATTRHSTTYQDVEPVGLA